MRFAAVLLLAACGDSGPDLDLRLDAVVHADRIVVAAVEASPPHACDFVPFPELGVCDTTSDALVCSNTPPWLDLDGVRVERDGFVLAEATWDDDLGTASADLVLGDAPARLVIVADGGDEVAVPIPVVPRPVPTIVDIDDLGDAWTIEWTSEPEAASAILEVGAGFGGPRCHARRGELPELAWGYDNGAASVLALTTPSTLGTAFGEVRVWTAGSTSTEPP